MAILAPLKRLTYLVHRWSGVGACVLMALWLVSGVVMLYVGYPRLLPEERLPTLPALNSPACCVPVATALANSRAPGAVQQITLTSRARHPYYRLKEATGHYLMVDAITGKQAVPMTLALAQDSARAFLPGVAAARITLTDDDTWTHSRALDAHRPLFKVEMADADHTWLYVSSTTGEVVMDAPRAQRYWNYVGAWLHWLYMFREGSKDPVWHWLVVVLSAVGTVVTITGACVGLWRWRFAGRYKSGSRTPYRDTNMRWHHITGLLFGGILFTWMFSGLMSMNPLGIFSPSGERPHLANYQQGVPGSVLPGIATADALALLEASGFTAHELEWRVLSGAPYLLARNAAGATQLVVADAKAGAFSVQSHWPDKVLARAGAHLIAAPVRSAHSRDQYDRFYYARQSASMYAGDARPLPVLRLTFADPGSTIVYLSPATGELLLSLDSAQRKGRWLFNFLHSWDLPVFLRAALWRDVGLILLSLGALGIALTGVVIGYRRLKTLGPKKPRRRRADRATR